MAGTVSLEIQEGLAIARMERPHGNAINDELVDDLSLLVQEVESDSSVRGVLLAARGKLFSPGLDLLELIDRDRPDMERFLHRFGSCIQSLFTLSKPLVAAIHGPALAGGCILTLTADWRVLRRGAPVGLNEVRVGVPLPFGVSMILRETVPRRHLEEVALFGRNYVDEQALEVGLAHELGPDDGFEEACVARLAELASRDGAAFAVTKRYLRSQTVERIRANNAQLVPEFLDCWFSASTRARMTEMVEGLRKR